MVKQMLSKVQVLGVAVIGVMLIISQSNANTGDPTSRSVETIRLAHAAPWYVMSQLGIFEEKDALEGRYPAWIAGDAKDLPVLPKGIDLVVPYNRDNSLVVGGSQEGIEAFKAIAVKLDVETKQVLVKVEMFKTSGEDISNLSLEKTEDGWTCGYLNSKVLGALREHLLCELVKEKVKCINSPIISTLDNIPAYIKTGTQSPDGKIVGSSELMVHPRINKADNSITVTTKVNIVGPFNPALSAEEVESLKIQPLVFTKRVGQGETIALFNAEKESGLLLLITPTITETQKGIGVPIN